MASVLSIVIALLAVYLTAVGIWITKKLDQQRRDKTYKRTYILTLPAAEVDAQQVRNFLAAVHGLVQSSRQHLTGSMTIVFELWAQGGYKTPRLRVPVEIVEDIRAQLFTAVPGIRMDVEKYRPRKVWTTVEELAMFRKGRSLHEEEPWATSSRLTTQFGQLRDNEILMMQWVITAAGRSELPIYKEAKTDKTSLVSTLWGSNTATKDEVNDIRKKVSEPNLYAALRVGAVADTQKRADQLVQRVRKAIAPLDTSGTWFVARRWLWRDAKQKRIDMGSGSTSWPVKLTLSEMTRVLGLPVGGSMIGFAPGRSSDLAPSQLVPQEGIVIGHSTYPGMESQKIAIPWDSTTMHVHVIGRIGTGKSVFTSNVALQIIKDKRRQGLVVLEIEGNLIDLILDGSDMERADDFIVIDFANMRSPVGFNFLAEGNPYKAVDNILELLEHRFGRGGLGVWAREYIENGLRTLAEFPELTIVDLVPLISPQTPDEVAWVRWLTGQLKDDDLRRWWARHDDRKGSSKQERADPALSRIYSLMRSELRYVFGQSKSAFTWREALNSNKIVLFNFKGIPKESAKTAAAMVLNSLWDTVKEARMETPTHLIMDEFGDYMDTSTDIPTMMDQSRKHNLPMWLIHQRMNQLSMEVKDAIMNNTRTKVAFQTTADNGRILRDEFGGVFKETDFPRIPEYEAIAKIKASGGEASPVTVKTLPPSDSMGNAAKIRQRSDENWGTPLAQVKREYHERHKVPADGYGVAAVEPEQEPRQSHPWRRPKP